MNIKEQFQRSIHWCRNRCTLPNAVIVLLVINSISNGVIIFESREEISFFTGLFRFLLFICTPAVSAFLMYRWNRKLDSFLTRYSDTSREERAPLIDSMEPLIQNITSCSQGLSESTLHEAEAMGSISESISVMTARTKIYSEYTQTADSLTQNTLHSAEHGTEQMKQMHEAMQEMRKQIHNVTKIIKAIDKIAYNTIILGINASVEANLAGDAGKGFQVVADEIRRMATNASEASNESKKQLDEILTVLANSEKNIDNSSSIFNDILKEIAQISSLISDISDKSIQQFSDIKSASEGLNKIDTVVQQNMGNSAEIKISSSTLKSQLEQIKELDLIVPEYSEPTAPAENMEVIAPEEVSSKEIFKKETGDQTFEDMNWDFSSDNNESDSTESQPEEQTFEDMNWDFSSDNNESVSTDSQPEKQTFEDMNWDFSSDNNESDSTESQPEEQTFEDMNWDFSSDNNDSDSTESEAEDTPKEQTFEDMNWDFSSDNNESNSTESEAEDTSKEQTFEDMNWDFSADDEESSNKE